MTGHLVAAADCLDVARLKRLTEELQDRFVCGKGVTLAGSSATEALAPPHAAGAAEMQGSRMEWLQHLVSLGYLHDFEVIATDAGTEDRMCAAFDSFLADLSRANHNCSGTALATEIEDALNRRPPGPIVLEAVERLLSFDQGTAIPSDMTVGDQNLWSRALHHRLAALNLYSGAIEAPVGDTTVRALRRLDFMISPSRKARNHWEKNGASARSISQILGDWRAEITDISKLLRAFERTLDVDPLIYHDSEGEVDRLAYFDTVVVVDGEFENLTIMSRLGDWFSDSDPVRPKWEGPVGDRAMAFECRFGLGLIQLALWSSGYYGGRLDGFFQAGTRDALRTMAADRDIDINRIILSVGDGYFVFNLHAARHMLFGPYPEVHVSPETEAKFISHELETRFVANMTERDGFWTRLGQGLRDALKAGRRILTGTVSVLKAIGDGIRRGIRAVGRVIGGALDAVGGVFVYLFRGVRDAVHLIRRGMQPFLHFILRQPVWTTDNTGRPVAMMDHDLDRDVIHWIAPWASNQQIHAHSARIERLARALDFTLSVVTWVIDIARVAFLPGGLLIVALKIVRGIRHLFEERFSGTVV